MPNTQWSGETLEAGAHPPNEPLLTAVVISRDDEDVIERAVDGILAQDCEFPVQIVVVTSGTDRTAEIVRSAIPMSSSS